MLPICNVTVQIGSSSIDQAHGRRRQGGLSGVASPRCRAGLQRYNGRARRMIRSCLSLVFVQVYLQPSQKA